MELDSGWELASSPHGACVGPDDLNDLEWHPAQVPGTAAAALGANGREDFDSEDWWFRARFVDTPAAGEERLTLSLDGIATVGEVFLNGERILQSSSMWATHSLDVTLLVQAENELVIVCRALSPLLAVRRRPSARWRTRTVNNGSLRWYRTMIFGRSPGFAPGPAPVGPWRPVRLTRQGPGALESLSLRTSVKGDDGLVTVQARGLDPARHVEVVVGDHRQELRAAADGLRPAADGTLAADLLVPNAQRWSPHTHGEPALHDLSLELDGLRVATRRIGFRTLSYDRDSSGDGLDLHVNGIAIFVRGAVWTPPDLISLAPSPSELRQLLVRVRDAGMNMLRVVGTGAYETPLFHDLCDELGILVWQDLMFANLDYPVADPDFRKEVQREARQVLGELGGHPSLAVVCGNSEVEQQAAMVGLDPALGSNELWEETLPQILAETHVDAAYIRSTPSGGDLPFRTDRGVTHYFGVSGYFRPLEDARRADVRFAAECLAFANVPDEVEVPVHHPQWKAGVARDAGTSWDQGAGWDFDDVRDFYLRELFGVDPVQLRRSDHDRYLELSRAASGEVMAELMGEWRRASSSCNGALVLWLKDMLPGAGLGVIDHRGLPKVAYHHLRRALAPVAVWSADEGLGGVVLHVANDRPEPLHAQLRVALYRDFEHRVDHAQIDLELEPHSQNEWNVEALIGHFVDAAWAYRFGPPAQNLIVASLEQGDRQSGETRLISQTFRFPAGRPSRVEADEQLGLQASATVLGPGGDVELRVRSCRLLYGVRLQVPGFDSSDDAFSVEPGGERRVRLRRRGARAGDVQGGNVQASDAQASDVQASDAQAGEVQATVVKAALTALNLEGRAVITVEPA